MPPLPAREIKSQLKELEQLPKVGIHLTACLSSRADCDS